MTTGGRQRRSPDEDEHSTRPCRQFPKGRAAPPRLDPGTDADQMVTALYSRHYASLVRLAAVLIPDIATAEELVQDSFVAMHAACPSVAGPDGAWLYLCHSVVRRCSATLRLDDVGDQPTTRSVTDPAGIVVSTLRSL